LEITKNRPPDQETNYVLRLVEYFVVAELGLVVDSAGYFAVVELCTIVVVRSGLGLEYLVELVDKPAVYQQATTHDRSSNRYRLIEPK